jgi:hypothetical protein
VGVVGQFEVESVFFFAKLCVLALAIFAVLLCISRLTAKYAKDFAKNAKSKLTHYPSKSRSLKVGKGLGALYR